MGGLTKRFPDSTPSHVEALVGQEYDALAANPIRMFISNLVERDARRRLRSEAWDARLKV